MTQTTTGDLDEEDETVDESGEVALYGSRKRKVAFMPSLGASKFAPRLNINFTPTFYQRHDAYNLLQRPLASRKLPLLANSVLEPTPTETAQITRTKRYPDCGGAALKIRSSGFYSWYHTAANSFTRL